MAWERRNGTAKLIYYAARRVGTRVVKKYLGSGAVAHEAAREVEDRRAERTRAALAASELAARRRPAEMLLDQQFDAAIALAEAALLAAGFRRPSRHGWRAWREGLRALRAAG